MERIIGVPVKVKLLSVEEALEEINYILSVLEDCEEHDHSQEIEKFKGIKAHVLRQIRDTCH